MRKFVIRRLIFLLPVVFGVITLVFFLIHFIPGDPVDVMLGESAMPADREALRHELGLDRPIHVQYLKYLAGLAHGDLGRSLFTGETVLKSVATTFPATLKLTVVAMIVAIMIALPLGIISAVKQYSFLDNASMFLALLGVSLPNFWLGPVLIIIFAIHFYLLPVSGMGGPAHFVLPAITLGTSMAAILTRMTRSSMLEVLSEDYISTARAKGLSETRVLVKHALRNALIPVVTVSGLQFGALLAGSIITEYIFAWPGLGRLIIQAIEARDFPLVQGCVLCISLTYVLVNMATDLVYGFIDPRIRYS